MKILHIIWSLTNGGMENMLIDIVNYQVEHANVHLMVINNRIEQSVVKRLDKRCHLKLLDRKEGSKNPWCLYRINSYILFNHFDIVHLHNPDLIKYMLFRNNYVRTVHNTHIKYQNYRWHKGIIAISDAVRDDLLNRNVSGSIVINNGVNFRLIKRKIYVSPGKPFRMIQVSRVLFEQKGQDILVQALEKLLKRGIDCFHLDLIGSGIDEQRLRDLIAGKMMNSHITMLGNKSREYVYDHLRDYDLFVQPSRFEGFGLTVAEAMGAGIPVLVSENEGPLGIIERGKYGFTFENNSVDDCARQIEKLMKNYPDQEYIETAFQHAVSMYDINVTAQQYLQLYDEIINRK